MLDGLELLDGLKVHNGVGSVTVTTLAVIYDQLFSNRMEKR